MGGLYLRQKEICDAVPAYLSNTIQEHTYNTVNQLGVYFDIGETRDGKLKFWSEDCEAVRSPNNFVR